MKHISEILNQVMSEFPKSKIEQLQEIRKDMYQGDFKLLAALSRVNSGVLSNYLKNCHRMTLRPQIVDSIISGYEKFKKEHR